MATYNVTAQTRRVQYTGNGTAGNFAFSFQINATSELKVYVDSTEKTETTHYTVTLNSGTGAGTVAFTSGNFPTSSQTVTLLSDIPLSRTSIYTSGGQLTASSLEDDFDTNMFIHQQTNEEIDRSLRLAEHDVISGADMTLPVKATRAGKILGFNETTGNPEASILTADAQSLADIASDIATLADIEDGTDATDAIQTVAGISTSVSNVSSISSAVSGVNSNSNNINTVSSNITDVGKVATIDANVTKVANIDSDVTAVANIDSNVTTVAGKASLITSDFASGMSLVTSDFVSDVNTLAVTDIINDINLLATSDIVADLNSLASTDFIADINSLATTDVISDLNTLATSDIIADINLLATTDVVNDLALLATSDFVADLNTLATTTNINNLSTVAGANTNLSTVAGAISNINTLASSNSNITNVSNSIDNVNTVASNLAGVNSFGERYRVGSSLPTTSLDQGDLFFNTTENELRVYNGTAFQATAPSTSDLANINIVAGEITSTEDLGSIADSIDTSSGNNIDTVANAITNINTVAGANSNISTLAGLNTEISNLNSISSAISGVNTISSAVSAVNSNSSNINAVNSNSSNINTVSGSISNINTVAGANSNISALSASAVIADMNLLATTAVIQDMGLLATSAVIEDMGLLATSAVIEDMGILGTSANVTAMQNVSDSIGIVNTVASNITNVNNFADRYRVGSSDPTSNNDEGDLFYNSSSNTLKFFDGSSYQSLNTTGLNNIVEDTSPQLGGNLDVVTHSIVSTSNRNIAITPNGSGKVVIDGLSHPTSDGSNGQFLKTNGSGVLTFSSVTQATGNELENLSEDTSPQLGGNLDVNGASIVSASNGHIVIDPNGSGLIKLVGSVDTTNLTMDFGSIA